MRDGCVVIVLESLTSNFSASRNHILFSAFFGSGHDVEIAALKTTVALSKETLFVSK